ncbi:MAG: M48 family metallopeptidase [Thermoanaerobaculia bacterium]|nr:M48 family metallopeptidase [Thermoanaerobaculia bacterium]
MWNRSSKPKRSPRPKRKQREKRYTLEIDGLSVEVVRKDIKNLYLRLQPPDGAVRASVPWRLGDEAVRQMVNARAEWIREHQERFAQRPSRPVTECRSGEIHAFEGRGHRLEVVEIAGRSRVQVGYGDGVITMTVGLGTSRATREAALERWYRRELAQRIPRLVVHWEPILGVSVAEWRIRKMKTRWGTCNTQVRRIWLGLELMKRTPACLEYVVVHEMVHLLERSHNARFWGLMDTFLPDWREQKAALSRPLAEGLDSGAQMSTCSEEADEGEETSREPEPQRGQRSLWV